VIIQKIKYEQAVYFKNLLVLNGLQTRMSYERQTYGYLPGEYACAEWKNSAHAKKVDVALNATNRLITGCFTIQSDPHSESTNIMWSSAFKHKTRSSSKDRKIKTINGMKIPYGVKFRGSPLKSRKI